MSKQAGKKKKNPKAATNSPMTASRLPQRILLIEDDENFAQVLAFALEQQYDCHVLTASDSFEAGNVMSQHAFDLVITDWKLPALNGFGTLRRADQGLSMDPEAPEEWLDQRKVPVIVITACDSSEIDREKKLKGRFQFVGVVSKAQPMEGILQQIEILFGNSPLAASA